MKIEDKRGVSICQPISFMSFYFAKLWCFLPPTQEKCKSGLQKVSSPSRQSAHGLGQSFNISKPEYLLNEYLLQLFFNSVIETRLYLELFFPLFLVLRYWASLGLEAISAPPCSLIDGVLFLLRKTDTCEKDVVFFFFPKPAFLY